MSEQEAVSLSRSEIRGIQLNSWICAILMGAFGGSIASRINPGLARYGYVPVFFLLMAIPMYTYLRLERRLRNARELTITRFIVAVLAGALIGTAVAFALETFL